MKPIFSTPLILRASYRVLFLPALLAAWAPAESTGSVYGFNGENGVDAAPRAFLTHEGALVVGGEFTLAGGQIANRIARWDGTWHTYGDGFNGSVNALAEFNGGLVAGGSFTFSGSQPVNRIAAWNGTTWDPLGSGLDGTVGALATYNGELFAGGNFSTAGGLTAIRIARWNGTTWSSVGGGFPGSVSHLVVSDGALCAAGAAGVRAWDGLTWIIISDPQVFAMAGFDYDLVFSRYKMDCCGVPPYRLFRYNVFLTTELPSLPTGVATLADYFGTLVGSGTLPSGEKGVVGLDQTNSWYLLARSVDLQNPAGTGVRVLKAHDGVNVKGLFVAGEFTRMGGEPSYKMALINPEWKQTAIQEGPFHSRLRAFPNPFRRSVTIEFTLEKQTHVEVTVLDVQGRVVSKMLDQVLPPGAHESTWKARNSQGQRAPAGMYFLRVSQGNKVDSRKIVLID